MGWNIVKEIKRGTPFRTKGLSVVTKDAEFGDLKAKKRPLTLLDGEWRLLYKRSAEVGRVGSQIEMV